MTNTKMDKHTYYQYLSLEDTNRLSLNSRSWISFKNDSSLCSGCGGKPTCKRCGKCCGCGKPSGYKFTVDYSHQRCFWCLNGPFTCEDGSHI